LDSIYFDALFIFFYATKLGRDFFFISGGLEKTCAYFSWHIFILLLVRYESRAWFKELRPQFGSIHRLPFTLQCFPVFPAPFHSPYKSVGLSLDQHRPENKQTKKIEKKGK